MPPKYSNYGSPLLAILRGGKQAVQPQPTFDIPTTLPTIPPLSFKTAQSTKATTLPPPPLPSLIPPTRVPLNPLDIIRGGKEQSISQGTRKKLVSDPTGILAGTGRAEMPAINESIAQTIARTVREKGLLPATGNFLFGEFTKLTSPNPEQYAQMWTEDKNRLISQGISEKRANQVATQNIFNQTKAPGFSMTGGDIVPQADLGVELTAQERGVLRGSNLMREAFAVLDAPIFMGTTQPIKLGIKGLIKPFKYTPEMTKAVNDMADVFNGTRRVSEEKKTEMIATVRSLADTLVKNEFIEPNVAVKGDKELADILLQHINKSNEILLQPNIDTANPKNFKTAEEYVKAQGTPVYHGGEASKIDEILKKAKEESISKDKWEKSRGILNSKFIEKNKFNLKTDSQIKEYEKLLLINEHLKTYKQGEGLSSRLIPMIKKLGIETKQLYGGWNGFGYEKLGQGIVNYSAVAKKKIQNELKDRLDVLKQITEKTGVSSDEKIIKSLETNRVGTVSDAIYNLNKEAKKLRDKRFEIGESIYGENAYRYGKQNSHEAMARMKEDLEDIYYLKDKYLKKIIDEIGEKPKGFHSFDDGIDRDYYEIGGHGFHINENISKNNLGEIEGAITSQKVGKKYSLENAKKILKMAFDENAIKTRSQLIDEWNRANNPVNKKLEAFRSGKPNTQGGYIANPLAGKPKPQVNNQGVSLDKSITQVDRLIAEGKIRVVSRDGQNVYQTKVGNKWINRQDSVKEEVKAYKATEQYREKTVVPAKAVDQVRELQKVAPEQVRSLEEVAQQIDEVVDLPPKQKPESLKDIVTQTPVERKVHLLDYFRTPDRVLNKIGFGKEARLLRNQYEKYVIELPKNIDKISDWVKRVPRESNERIFDFLDGKEIKLTKAEQEVATEIKDYLKEWADRLNLPEDNRVTNYITRLFEDTLIQKEFDEELAKIITDKIPGEVYNPFLQKRLGAKGYKRDTWAALDAYTKRATRKVHLDPALERIQEKAGSSLDFTPLEESQFNFIKTYVDRVQMRPTKIDNLVDNGVKQVVGYRFGQRPVAQVSSFLRRMTYRGMLGANLGSALRNLSQGINTYATLGEKYTVIGYAKMFNTNSWKELNDNGVLAHNFIEDRVLSSTKKALQKADKALWFFFDQAEKINRGSAYFGAKAKGVNKGMNESDAVEYAKSIVRKTQFQYDGVDTPVVLGSDLVKTLAQFQTFTTKQIEFLAEMVKDKNFVGLMRYAIAGYVFVNTVGQAMGMEEKELLPWYRFDVPPSLKFPWEAIKTGMVTSGVPLKDKYGNELSVEKQAKNTGKALLGLIPGGLQARKTVQGMQAIKEGGSFDAAGRIQFEQGDTPAQKVQSLLFGKYASPNAKEYFNKDTKSGDPELDRFLKQDKKETADRNKQVSKLVTELKGLPPEEANARLKELAREDEDLVRKVVDKVKDEKKQAEWTNVDKAIAKLGVENGKRAEYVYNKTKTMTLEEANAYLKDLARKGVISKNVIEQIKELKDQEQQ